MRKAPSRVFVIHGDLTSLHAHGYFIPSSATLSLDDQWRETLVDPDRDPQWEPLDPSGSARVRVGWERDALPSHGVLAEPPDGLTDASAGRPPGPERDRLFVVTDIFVPNAVRTDHLLSGIDHALDAVADRWAGRPAQNRERPLLAMPLVGTGRGGFNARQGLVVKDILQLLDRRVSELPFDIALVCFSRAQYAAVQRTREQAGLCLPNLPAPLARAATELGDLAEGNSLGVLFGAGLSIPLGLPTWHELLGTLAAGTEAGAMDDLRDLDPIDAASLVISALEQEAAKVADGTAPSPERDVFLERIRGLVTLQRHSLGHGLLASFRPVVAVTTNYDEGYELALRHVVGDEELAVLPWYQPASAGSPRVLKIHGDVHFGSVVLSRDHFVMMHAIRRPLTALLQEQMLAGHVLAVGTSFTDSTLISAIAEASSMLRSIERERPLGTLLMNQRRPARAALLKGAMRVLEADGPPWEEPGQWSPSTEVDSLGAGTAGVAAVAGEDDDPDGWPAPGEPRLDLGQAGRLTELFLDHVGLHSSSKVNYLADGRFADLIDDEPQLEVVAERARELRSAIDAASSGPDDLRWREILAALDDLGATARPHPAHPHPPVETSGPNP